MATKNEIGHIAAKAVALAEKGYHISEINDMLQLGQEYGLIKTRECQRVYLSPKELARKGNIIEKLRNYVNHHDHKLDFSASFLVGISEPNSDPFIYLGEF